LYSKVKFCNYCKSNVNKSINYIDYVFEDRKEISGYKNNSESYSSKEKFELENKMLSRYLYLEEMKTHVRGTLENEDKILTSVISKLDKDNQKVYKDCIEPKKELTDVALNKQKTELSNKIETSVFNLKNYYGKRLNDLSKEQELYLSQNDMSGILKSLSDKDKKSYIDNFLEKNNEHIRSSMKGVNELENRLMKIDNDPTVSKIISKLELSKKDAQKYALNVKTEGKYFRCIREIDVIKADKKIDPKTQIDRLNTLTKLKIEYEKLDTKDLEKKLTSKYDSIIEKYQKSKTEKIKTVKVEIQKKYTDIKVTQVSNKVAKGQVDFSKNKGKTYINVLASGSKIYGGINMNESKKKKEKDSATKMLTEQIDGIEY